MVLLEIEWHTPFTMLPSNFSSEQKYIFVFLSKNWDFDLYG